MAPGLAEPFFCLASKPLLNHSLVSRHPDRANVNSLAKRWR
jgi:hypothetical protein